MAPLVLEGETLGQKHKHLNNLVKEYVASQPKNIEKINIEDSDVNNLLKIDVANAMRNVEYILEVLKCEDMLYVSRAIKNCTWMITDSQYSYIINPEYLYSQLFPYMTTKATNKLLLHIRLHLKDEKRVEGFFQYYRLIDRDIAFKWLPRCSLAFIEKVVSNNDINDYNFIARLSEKSTTIPEIYCRKTQSATVLSGCMFLLHNDIEKYLDILESVHEYEVPCLNANITKVIMKKCPQRIIDKIERYRNYIHIPTFAKYIKKEDIKDFVLKQLEGNDRKYWLQHEKMEHFIKYMPKEDKNDFVKRLINLETINDTSSASKNSDVYQWYRYVPYSDAFPEIIKLIRVEPSPTERTSMFSVLLKCAGRNPQHIYELLKYYTDHHINEPFKFKIPFINNVICNTDTHRYDTATWGLLNKLFGSLEVYMSSGNEVSHCIQSIILHQILRGEKVPEIIEQKFKFHTLKKYRNRLNMDEQELVFNYLYNWLITQMSKQNITSEAQLEDVVMMLSHMLALFKDWEKNLADYPFIVDKIKNVIKIRKENGWNVSFSVLYNAKKSWRKVMFNESVILSPTEETCINILKHNPQLMLRYSNEIEELCNNDAVSMRRVLNKVRIYWPSFASQWTTAYHAQLERPHSHKAAVRGLCILLTQKDVVELVTKFIPEDHKIKWDEIDEQKHSLRKNFASNLYLARPLIPLHAILGYAKGDYVQYTIPSINSILSNFSCTRIRELIPKLLDFPVSLQKHGIRICLSKLKIHDMRQTYIDMWKATKNLTIRATLFKACYNLLCKENNSASINEIWDILSMYMDNLTSDENKVIYDILSKISNVPLSVRPLYCMKGYTYLKSLQAKGNRYNINETMIAQTLEIIHSLNNDFVENVLLESIDKKIITRNLFYRNTYCKLLAAYMFSSKDETLQNEKFQRFLVPLLESVFAIRDDTKKITLVRGNVYQIMKSFCSQLVEYVIEKKMIIPLKLFVDIQQKLVELLPLEENYVFLTFWNLVVLFTKSVQKNESSWKNSDFEHQDFSEREKTLSKYQMLIARDFGELVIIQLKEDVDKHDPTIYPLFSTALDHMFRVLEWGTLCSLIVCENMLLSNSFVPGYLTVISVFRTYCSSDEEKEKINNICRMIYCNPSKIVKMHYHEQFSGDDDMLDLLANFTT